MLDVLPTVYVVLVFVASDGAVVDPPWERCAVVLLPCVRLVVLPELVAVVPLEENAG